MNLFRAFIIILIVGSGLPACQPNQEEAPGITESCRIVSIAGDYVSLDYSQRSEGYDWIAVSVSEKTDSLITVKVRSRADRKQPTCTFDAVAKKISEYEYAAQVEGSSLMFAFTDSSINILTETEEQENVLYYYCSGGGNFVGTYSKLDEVLDSEQIDPRNFVKELSLQNITFHIHSLGEGSIQTLVVAPFGLSITNTPDTIETDGSVVNAEVADLNDDGFPEVLVYTQSAGSGSYGDVIGYSVNNGKSMSRISFPPVAENSELYEGYMGHDEFAIVETNLVQRFPIYEEGNTNSQPSDKYRQISYSLESGEASRVFSVKSVDQD